MQVLGVPGDPPVVAVLVVHLDVTDHGREELSFNLLLEISFLASELPHFYLKNDLIYIILL